MRAWLLSAVVLAACGSGPRMATRTDPGRPAVRELRKARPARFPAREATGLVPREVLFGEPHRKSVQLSYDGKRIGFLGDDRGRMQLFLAPTHRLEEKTPVRLEAGVLERWMFAPANDWIIYLQDPASKEEPRVYALDVASNTKSIDLTPPRRMARVSRTSSKRPYEVALLVRTPNAEVDDVFVADIRTGASKMVFENKERFVMLGLDEDFVPRIGVRPRDDGDQELRRLLPDGTSMPILRIDADGLTASVIGLDAAGKTVYLRDSRGRNTGALAAIDLASGKETILAEDPRADALSVLREAETGRPEAVAFDSGKRRWRALDEKTKADLAALEAEDVVIDVVDRSADRGKWIVVEHAPDRPTTYLLYDRATRTKRVLFEDRPELGKQKLSPMDIVSVKTRDGLDLVAYLTLPRGPHPIPAAPVPLVLVVHGGPWDRDAWELDPIHQLLSSRGYAALSVNYRGSTGFGKALANAGDREWGGKMQDDLVDAVHWAVAHGIADPKRVAIFGGSWGGYAALVGTYRDRGTFSCAVDIVGPADLVSLVDKLPARHRAMAKRFRARVGDPSTDAGRRDLAQRSCTESPARTTSRAGSSRRSTRARPRTSRASERRPSTSSVRRSASAPRR